MTSVLLSLPDLYNSYKNWVSKNPQNASEYETASKWLSYFIAGRINNSHVMSELVYCVSNLLVLFNDQIIRECHQHTKSSSSQKLKVWLTIIEYSEVFCELSAQKLWGNRGRWLIITAIQIFKCIARLQLIYKHKETIIVTPSITPLERDNISQNNTKSLLDLEQNGLNSASFTLKRSGRVVRKVESSPPLPLRNWKPLEPPLLMSNTENDQTVEKALTGKQLLAETLYVIKPIAHLCSVGCFGANTWKPWILSIAMDLTSLQLYKSIQKKSLDALTRKQRLQLSRRMVVLVLYLIRSPVYEKYTGNKLHALLLSLSKNLPLARIICQPLSQYLPFWQSNYFYMWST
ncbi:peroxisomal membrane protein PEX16 [Cylas formicarius]|uniref:peroxisomal membrane protein PEX16 n=1 Tax=Cylas formicarius TaxID=197179 RepID=UPI0029584F45|nr:peroxisomal membrane protein PEX16 [Cylas formicarius]